jgi:5'-methylthioadenosine phosphorylase
MTVISVVSRQSSDSSRQKLKTAIIGGTGVYDPGWMSNDRPKKINTPFGEVTVRMGKSQDKEVAFVSRHGEEHNAPPHLINYRANIWALKKMGVRNILATAAVGSLNPAMKPGDFVFTDQFLDFTKTRAHTFIEQGGLHPDMTAPYCATLCHLLSEAAGSLNLRFHPKGTYVCTEGPRFETPAEIHFFQKIGGDLVGMTGVPEVTLAREAGICYACSAVVTNFAAGISTTLLSHQEVVAAMEKYQYNLRRLLNQVLILIDENRNCFCQASAFLEVGGTNRKC